MGGATHPRPDNVPGTRPMTPSLAFFAVHELHLGWRDVTTALGRGKPVRAILAGIATLAFWLGMHWLADLFIAPWRTAGVVADKHTLVVASFLGVVFFSAMLSQALEAITRAFYTRADLDLILSSPAPASKLFAVRAGAIALTSMALAAVLASPAVNVAAFRLGPHWLAAYGAIAAIGAAAVACALLLMLALFRLFGPARTRLIAQILGGLVGAGFAIGIQAVAIVSYGSMSRLSVLDSPQVLAALPEPDSPLFWPARAAMGNLWALGLTLAIALCALALAIRLTAKAFPRLALAAASMAQARSIRARPRAFRTQSPRAALRTKEWQLLLRNPWLVSESLMQILYLVPPALLLWINYGSSSGVAIVIVPVLVMAGGQLAGGLAWLAVSGEDAPDLVATAPIAPALAIGAKLEAVLVAMGIILAPFILALALSLPWAALVTATCALLAASASTLIQAWFRNPARRAMFRRRHAASRAATLCEAMSSIMWAGTAALLAAGSWLLAAIPAVLALATLLVARLLRPRRNG